MTTNFIGGPLHGKKIECRWLCQVIKFPVSPATLLTFEVTEKTFLKGNYLTAIYRQRRNEKNVYFFEGFVED